MNELGDEDVRELLQEFDGVERLALSRNQKSRMLTVVCVDGGAAVELHQKLMNSPHRFSVGTAIAIATHHEGRLIPFDALKFSGTLKEKPSIGEPSMKTEIVHDKRFCFLAEKPGIIYVHRSDRDRDHPIVYVKAYEKRLNRRDCIGQPIGLLEDAIAQPRREAINRLVETGENQVIYTSYTDRNLGLIFDFKTLVEKFSEGEILLTVLDQHRWQEEYWAQRERYEAQA